MMLLFYIPIIFGLALLSALLMYYFDKNKVRKLLPLTFLTFFISCSMPLIGLLIPVFIATRPDIEPQH
ncbi:hypothetical protein [Alteromonas sp. A079]|uniref:hypothetical protein n=1 Tax=Alteromonas sp. A079 TaxID=3410268 RepID=UPI003B9ED4EE